MSESQSKKKPSAFAMLADSDEDFSVWDVIGGWRGLCESTLPIAVFVIAFIITSKLWLSLALVVALIVVIVAVRLIQKKSIAGLLSGSVPVVLFSAIFALLNNSARDFYSPGIYINIFFFVVLAISVAINKPLIGIIIDNLSKEKIGKQLHTHYVYATCIWILGFAIRIGVEIPLYMSHNITFLGVARIATGIPLFAIMSGISWLIIAPARKKILANMATQSDNS